MNKFRFLDWEVYKDSKILFSDILKVVRQLPRMHQFGLGDQLTRSALSIVLNVAEGSGKATDKELSRFISIALGSVYEVLAAIDVCRDNALIKEDEFRAIREKLESISNQLGGFKKSLVVSRKSSVVSQKGVSLYLAFMILSLVLGIAIGGNVLLSQHLQSQRKLGYSVYAFGASDAGIEKIFYDDQKGINVLTQCPDTGGSPPQACTGSLDNGATYAITVTPPGPGCPAVEYCAKSVGSYQGFQRAIRIAR